MTKNWSFAKITDILLKKNLRSVIVSQNHYLNKILDVHPLSLLFRTFSPRLEDIFVFFCVCAKSPNFLVSLFEVKIPSRLGCQNSSGRGIIPGLSCNAFSTVGGKTTEL